MQLKFSWLILIVAFIAIAKAEEVAKQDEKVKIEILTPPPVDCIRWTKKYDKLQIHYVGTLTESGIKFDSSYDRNELFGFQLGTGQVIKGWEEGLLDMCEGEKRKLVVPASKGYGAQGAGDTFPPNTGLTFEVELREITDGTAPPNVFKAIDTDNDNRLSHDEVSEYLTKKQQEKETEGKAEEMTEEKHQELVIQVFQHEDTNKDGFISHEEFTGPKHEETSDPKIVPVHVEF